MFYRDLEEFKKLCGYELNGAWYPRVTKILEIKSKPALNVFLKEMESYEKAEQVKNKSAEEGSLVHSIIQGLLTGKDLEIPAEVAPMVSAFRKFNEETNIALLPEFVERQIWSPRYRYAGTVDAVALIGGKLGVLDIKTSPAFYPEYNLQTAAYLSALQEFFLKKDLGISREVETRWILRIDQKKHCLRCGATLRQKGGRDKVRNAKSNGAILCQEGEHKWGEVKGEVELREFPCVYKDFRAFMAAKILWEWENDYWLRQIGYLR